ncbi:MAG: DUF4405 domain-containing protein, partial [Clostridium sp.]
MKKINYIKFGLNILMAIVFVMLFNKRAVIPMTFHEIAGLVIGVAFIMHMTLNSKWIKQVSLNLFNSKTNFKTKLGYIIDILLLICFIIIIISGILISKVVFPNFRINSSISFKSLHISMSYITLLLVGIHLGTHWNWVVNVFKKIFVICEKKKSHGIIVNLVVVLLFIFGTYNIYSVNYISKVSMITTSFNVGRLEGGHKQDGETRNKLSQGESPRNKRIGDEKPADGSKRVGK